MGKKNNNFIKKKFIIQKKNFLKLFSKIKNNFFFFKNVCLYINKKGMTI
jgi:hypothetical protein